MENKLVLVKINGAICARAMELQDALLFVEALFNKYYNDKDLSIEICIDDMYNSLKEKG